MGNIITAKQSPRIEDGILKWYEGDTFSFVFVINLTDKDTGEPIIFMPEDTITFEFSNEFSQLIQVFSFDNIPFDNKVRLNFNEDVSRKFIIGKYKYSIKYNGINTVTLGACNKAEVEKCR